MPKLFCIPLLLKDNFDTVGMAASNGVYGLLDNFPSQDAFQVGRPPPALSSKQDPTTLIELVFLARTLLHQRIQGIIINIKSSILP